MTQRPETGCLPFSRTRTSYLRPLRHTPSHRRRCIGPGRVERQRRGPHRFRPSQIAMTNGKSKGLVARLFSPSPVREERPAPKVCNCPEDEIQRLAAALGTRSSSGSEQRGSANGTDAETQRGAHGTGEASVEQKPGRRRGRLVASLERAARRRLNGALGDSRAPSHYQAILPSKGIREREWRLWRLETGSQVLSPEGGGTPEGRQSGTPWSSSVDTLTSPRQLEN